MLQRVVRALNREQTSPQRLARSRLFAISPQKAERHLVIVHQPGWQSIEDWYQIATKISRIDTGIATFVVAADVIDPIAVKLAGARPTLVFSPGPLGRFAPARGKVYHGRPIGKFEQLRRLSTAGVRVP